MDEGPCPDCGLPLASGVHRGDCHVEWAENLRDVPRSDIPNRNPFIKLLKEANDAVVSAQTEPVPEPSGSDTAGLA